MPSGADLLLAYGIEWSWSPPAPLVMWVYASSMGSTYANRYGLWGDMPTFNMHLLATRGYAVLFPDVPVNVGTPVRDLWERRLQFLAAHLGLQVDAQGAVVGR